MEVFDLEDQGHKWEGATRLSDAGMGLASRRPRGLRRFLTFLGITLGLVVILVELGARGGLFIGGKLFGEYYTPIHTRYLPTAERLKLRICHEITGSYRA